MINNVENTHQKKRTLTQSDVVRLKKLHNRHSQKRVARALCCDAIRRTSSLERREIEEGGKTLHAEVVPKKEGRPPYLVCLLIFYKFLDIKSTMASYQNHRANL